MVNYANTKNKGYVRFTMGTDGNLGERMEYAAGLKKKMNCCQVRPQCRARRLRGT